MDKRYALIKKLEGLAAEAWPAKETQNYGEWLLRANAGVSKRANSLFTAGEIPESDWLTVYEQFYQERGLKPCVYISSITPKGAISELLTSQYKAFSNMFILVNKAETVLTLMDKKSTYEILIEPELTEEWLRGFMTLENHPSELEEGYRSIFQDISLRKAFLSIRTKDRGIIAVATAILKEDWTYICNVVVHSSYRRQGLASYLLYHLADWSLKNGAASLFMQVMQENTPALQLYKKLHFHLLSESYYMQKSSP